MKRLFCTVLALLLCACALCAPPAPVSAAAGGNLLAGASYTYVENCAFYKEYKDDAAKLLTDGRRRGDGTTGFDKDLAVAGTSVEFVGTNLENVIVFELKNELCLNRLLIRGVRQASNRYTNVAAVEISQDAISYAALSYTVDAVAIGGAPQYRVSEGAPLSDQFFDLDVTFPAYSSLLCGVKYIRLTLNTQASDARHYICQLDEVEAYGISSTPYPVKAELSLSLNKATLSVGESFAMTALLCNIRTPNGVVACDLPFSYDAERLVLTKVQGIFPADWDGTGMLAGSADLSQNPYCLRLLCNADDLASNPKYNVKANGVLGFRLIFKAKAAGNAKIVFENDAANKRCLLAVNGADFDNYSVMDAATSIKIHTGDPVPGLGDVNLDGDIDNLDASMVLQYDAGLIELDNGQFERADFNRDGEADNLDASEILCHDAGL